MDHSATHPKQSQTACPETTRMKIVMSHPTGNSNVRAVILALHTAGMLEEFNTTLAINPKSAWLNLVPKAMSEQLRRRSFPLSSSKLVQYPGLESARLLLPKLGLQKLVSEEISWASIDSVYRNLDLSVSKRLKLLVKNNTINAVYGYEDGALETFKQAKKLGLTCIYDLPIAYWETSRRLLMEEADRLPAWAETLGGGIKDSESKLQRKTEELRLADIVIGPGDFVLDSIPDWARTKQLIKTPFGSPAQSTCPVGRLIKSDGKLRVLFVGSMSQRKGLADLFAAIKLLNRSDVELIVMGSPLSSMEFYKTQLPGVTFLPTRSHNRVLDLMQSCDVLCLPSIVEGRALVMQEAMSQGLPLIITPNTGGEDLIVEGETGFIVPIRSPEVIAEKLNWLVENKAALPQMRQSAFDHAQLYTWETYGANIVSALSSLHII
jgi:glycosyltransferase involved in cell wall biosynthesis